MGERLEKKLCVSIGDKDLHRCIASVKLSEFAELRGDICELTTQEVVTLINYNPNLIFTYRLSKENERIAKEQMFAAVNKGVAYVDIEAEAPDRYIKQIRTAINEKLTMGRTKLIISHHDYEGTPDLPTLKKIVASCKKRGADLVKIVTTANTVEEASRILRLYDAKDLAVGPSQLVAFAMGDRGRFTRVASLYKGAPYAYCSATEPTASGQYSLGQMMKFFDNGAFRFRAPDKKDSDLFAKYGTAILHRKSKVYNRSLSIPCSKSIAQRAIIAAAIARGESVLRNFEPCNDIKAAIAFIRRAGCIVKVTRDGRKGNGEKMLIIKSPGIEKWKSFQIAEVGESGLLARMLLPLLSFVSSTRSHAKSTTRITVTGGGTLLKRDLSAAIIAMKNAGAACQGTARNGMTGEFIPISVGGTIKEEFTISGKESSQSVTGFLMALPLLRHDTVLKVENPASTPFIDLTLFVLGAFGIEIDVRKSETMYVFDIKGRQTYNPADFFMDSDWSGASNFAVAGLIASLIDNCDPTSTFTIRKMNVGTDQADEAILGVAKSCGGEITFQKPETSELYEAVRSKFSTPRILPKNLQHVALGAPDGKLKGFETDATNCPDLFPALAALAVFCQGTSRIKGVGRLFKKESNRAESIVFEFTRLGYNIYIEDDTLVIEGCGGKIGNTHFENCYCSAHNDHRIAMAIIITSLFRRSFNPLIGSVRLDNVECIDKSFPTFLERLQLSKEYDYEFNRD